MLRFVTHDVIDRRLIFGLVGDSPECMPQGVKAESIPTINAELGE
jgi:hypothetical protein